jgi:hypothetical protein
LKRPDLEIRPLILLGLRGGFLEAFCYSDDSFVDVVDDVALAIERLSQVRCVRRGLLELITKIVVRLFEIFSDAALAAESFTQHEAEGSRYQHP